MTESFQAIPLSPRVWWVGAIDWNLRSFHGYHTPRGTTYNAYLIMADHITLIDTVKAPFFDEMRARIQSVVDPSKIDYIISNHAEMDHSGALPNACEAFSPSRVFASKQGKAALQAHYHWTKPVEAVGSEPLDLGGCTLRFVSTPMLHWPDSMFCFLEQDRVLFSNDAFGMHLASIARFDDELCPELLQQEAGRYYANILWPMSALIQKLCARWPELNLQTTLIAPDHGPIWRAHPEAILGSYATWSAQKPQNKLVLTYDTMWGSTERLARAIAEGASSVPDAPRVELYSLAHNDRSDVVAALLGAGTLAVGSPTLNNQMYPTVAAFLTYLKGLKPKGLTGAAFGSFGWSGESPALIDAELNAIGLPSCAAPFSVRYVPDQTALLQAAQFGANLSQALSARLSQKD